VSLETTLAKASARAAQEKWNDHRKHCALCGNAGRNPKPGQVCPAGDRLLQDVRVTAAEVRWQMELDKFPDPNQGSLFDLPGQP